MERFEIKVRDDVLDDLRDRLKRTRWVKDIDNADWKYGANVDYLKSLVNHWLETYDWREREQRMNSFSHYKTEIDDMPIHFVLEEGKGPDPIPLMLNHGWPWSFWDFQKLIGPLTDPAAFGGNPADSFTVVVPSLPGYGFSTPLDRPGVNFVDTADMWVELMQRLGYPRFATQGSDWGAIISAQLGHKYAERLLGVHIQLHPPLDFHLGVYNPEDFSEAEQAQLAKNEAFSKEEVGYFALQTTKPQTPAVALNDSPAGLLGWIVEKRRRWSDCQGDVESVFSRDDLIDTAMLYWITESYGTSARYYYEAFHRPWTPFHNRMPAVEAPVAALVFPEEVFNQAASWRRRYYNLQRETYAQRGGHFGPMEQPQLLIDDLRAFFGPMRGSA